MSSPPFPAAPPFRFEDLKKYLHLEVNGYSMKREETELNTKYQNMSDIERRDDIKVIENQLVDKPYLLIENRYPYWLEDGMIHKIIWVNRKWKKNVSPETIAIEHLLDKGYKDFTLFYNSRQTKSVPSIIHHHVIYRL
ncbi:MAG: hypothetical protein PHG66_04430 [Candidatus Colwellbacteria bacterium]|nr:hypothetical protein [Candidatus Colwellbacteria bacterium]